MRDPRGFAEYIFPSQNGGFPVMKGFLPGAGHVPLLYLDALARLRRAEREQGSFVQVNLGFDYWLLFCFGPDSFELLKHRAVVMSGSWTALAHLVGGSLLKLDGPPHRRVRSVMNPTFSPRGLAESTTASRCRETVQQHAQAFVDGGGGEAHAHMQRMTLDVIFRIVGIESEVLDDWRAAYRRALLTLIPFPSALPGTPRHIAARASRWLDTELLRLVRRAASVDGQSLIHALLHSTDENGSPLSEDDLVANLRLLFLAGHETTATTLTWTLVHLATRPDLVRAIQEEVSAAGNVPPLTLADAKRLPLCEAIFREGVRLYGPVWFIERSLSEDLVVRDTLIPAGTTIALPAILWARDPAVHPDPDTFTPHRWLGISSGLTPYETAQFGGGPHFCLGYHLAWLEAIQYLAALAIALGRSGGRLRLARKTLPRVAFFPTPRPWPSAPVVIEAAR